ncbi:MAG: hypothetical protein L3K03_08035, partial [Thermoplasmata archaeon]|nr:hypothetical protein [Thermoplasmata archaeon]
DQIETFLVRHIRANPGLGFRDLVQAAQLVCHVSRATAARHLSRLVRFGEVALRPDRTYSLAEPTAPAPRPIVEVRWFDLDLLIRPDGTARAFEQREFRVVSGQLDHIEFTHPKPMRQFTWWCSTPAHMSTIPSIRSTTRLSTHRFEFATPLTARSSAWHRIQIAVETPVWYRMAYDPGHRAPRVPLPNEPSKESESIEVPSHGHRFGQRLAPDAHLGLHIVLPKGYPIGPARSRVRFLTEPGRVDLAEQLRVAKLKEDEWHQDGLRRFGTTFTLSIPRPKLDRHYEIQWTLPDPTHRARWLSEQGIRGSA